MRQIGDQPVSLIKSSGRSLRKRLSLKVVYRNGFFFLRMPNISFSWHSSLRVFRRLVSLPFFLASFVPLTSWNRPLPHPRLKAQEAATWSDRARGTKGLHLVWALAGEHSRTCQPQALRAELITSTCNLPPWSCGPELKPPFQSHRGEVDHLVREVRNHSAEKLIMFSKCFMICYSGQINRNKLSTYFLPLLSVHQIQKYEEKINPQIVRKFLGKLLSPFCITDPACFRNSNPFASEIDKLM